VGKAAKRGLPEDFTLNLPDDEPVRIGDFLEEEPPPIPVARSRKSPPLPAEDATPVFRPEIVRREEERSPARPVQRKAQPAVIRSQTESHSSY
jgi:hypothetical protein